MTRRDRGREVDAEIASTYRSYMSKASVRKRWSAASRANTRIARDRNEAAAALVRNHLPIGRLTALEIGCGHGAVLRELRKWVPAETRIIGADLVAERAREARRNAADSEILIGSGSELPLRSGTIDLVLLFTVLSSILSNDARRRVGAEIDRVLTRRGAIIVYDMRVPSYNPHVSAVSTSHLRAIFADYAMTWTSVTPAPPVARLLVDRFRLPYNLVSALLPKTHNMAILTRRGFE